MNCVFCNSEDITKHHLIPRRIRKIMNWLGKKSRMINGSYTVPLCEECHHTLNFMLEPLIFIIKTLKHAPPIPIELAFIMENSRNMIMNEKEDE